MSAALLTLNIDGVPTQRVIRNANTWWRRAIGLLATKELQHPCGLWLQPCNGVHTIGMRYPIDVLFLRADGVVLKVVPRLGPWRFARCGGAASTLELRAGLARRLGLKPGMSLDLMA
ncbi:MAG TPA: DUF192 domain-containing protein [Ideonella sp.]|uniref:DUF192 domain-containing protein n=1 Tax=Ideonella sp. TaxID=1929293 RepID=UPI002BF04C26|nr:DUF192 domain-containing protein [Ideonella sp.]HSI48233.1 DUF192 domain-containing protein [Ideonella sp.]